LNLPVLLPAGPDGVSGQMERLVSKVSGNDTLTVVVVTGGAVSGSPSSLSVSTAAAQTA